MGLEWTRDGYGMWAPKADGSRHWKVGVNVELDDAWFFVVGCDEKFPTLKAAKEWCEAEDAKLMPPVTTPQPGEVWGVIDKPSTWRMVEEFEKYIVFGEFSLHRSDSCWPDKWQAWVRESGAVRLDGPREDVDALRKELEAVKEGYHALDKNWETVHESAMRPIRKACGNSDLTVGEIVLVIQGGHERAENAEASALELAIERDNLKKYKTLFDTLQESLKTMAPYEVHDGPAVEGLLDKIQECAKLRKANEIARKGLEEIRDCVGSYISGIGYFGPSTCATNTLTAMNAAEGVQP